MHTKQLTDILLVFLIIFCFTSCNHDDVNFPIFTFTLIPQHYYKYNFLST